MKLELGLLEIAKNILRYINIIFTKVNFCRSIDYMIYQVYYEEKKKKIKRDYNI